MTHARHHPPRLLAPWQAHLAALLPCLSSLLTQYNSPQIIVLLLYSPQFMVFSVYRALLQLPSLLKFSSDPTQIYDMQIIGPSQVYFKNMLPWPFLQLKPSETLLFNQNVQAVLVFRSTISHLCSFILAADWFPSSSSSVGVSASFPSKKLRALIQVWPQGLYGKYYTSWYPCRLFV